MQTESPSEISEAVWRTGCGRSPEDMARAGVPGFSSYLPKDADPVPVQGPKGTPQMANMPYHDDDFSFGDFVDIWNPLQHIPLVGMAYRALTGDVPKPSTQMAGDILYSAGLSSLGSLVFGSVVGTATNAANATENQENGAPMDVKIAQAVFGGADSDKKNNIQLASAEGTEGGRAAIAAAAAQKNASRSAAAKHGASASAPAGMTAQTRALMASGGQTGLLGGGNSKAPFGGVMDMAGAQLAQKTGANDSQAQTGSKAAALNASIQTNKLMPQNPALKTHASLAQSRMAAPGSSSAAAFEKVSSDKGATEVPSAEALSTEARREVAPVSLAAGAATTTTATTMAAVETKNETPSGKSDANLGKVMHESADKVTLAHAVGAKNALPPELVQDMMAMALDKYKAAGVLGEGQKTARAE